MRKEANQFYRVDFQVLPAALKNTIRAKEYLKSGEAGTINEAVKKAGISRSAYYKYKDHVAPISDDSMGGLAVLFVVLHEDPALITRIFRRLNKERASVVTMNKGAALGKLTTMTLYIQTSEMQISLSKLEEELQMVKGVVNIYVMGRNDS